MNGRGWRKGQKEKFRATMKAKNDAKFALEQPKTAAAMNDKIQDWKQEGTVDLNQLREFHYRRGLVTAMECILRELR